MIIKYRKRTDRILHMLLTGTSKDLILIKRCKIIKCKKIIIEQ